jgi:quercetin dioxygenase-like cupin family protein
MISPSELTPVELAPGVALRVFVSGGATGAKALTVCSATFGPEAELPCHTHSTAEMIYALSGYTNAIVDERAYILRPGDLLLIPAGVRHSVGNSSGDPVCLYTFFPTAAPDRELVPPPAASEFLLVAPAGSPESIIRSGDSWRPTAEWPLRFEKDPNGFIVIASGERAVVTTKSAENTGSVLYRAEPDGIREG